MPFPNIEYSNDFAPLNHLNYLPESPRSLITYLLSRGIISDDFMAGINNMNELESSIITLLHNANLEDPDVIQRIFHLIQIWGGRMGRSVYFPHNYNWEVIFPAYMDLITSCLGIGKRTDIFARRTIFDAINLFIGRLHQSGVKGMNVAFVTKHTRFWLMRNNPENPLPIYDKTMSQNIMGRGPVAYLRHLLDYWDAMIQKAEEEDVCLRALERQLFLFYHPE